MDFYRQSIPQALENLKTSADGLSAAEAEKRRKTEGVNTLPRSRQTLTRIGIFLNQWKSPLIIILVLAGIVSGVLGEYTDMMIILVTALMNAGIGFFQEDKANQALTKLQHMITYNALVLREGKKQYIPSEDVVPGDILLLNAGDKVQADGRLLLTVELEINEAPLTGESVAIKKQTTEIKEEVVLADRNNMVFRGTTVTGGRGDVLVTATGKNTELGKIATLVHKTEEHDTPLQIQLTRLGRYIGIIVIGICAIIFLLGFFVHEQTYSFLELFQTSVAVAVAAIPEGLAISLTVILAIGMQHILKRQALVRKLVAAETLGSVSVICTDKTGTITEGKMKVTSINTLSHTIHASDTTAFTQENHTTYPDVFLAIRIGTLCNDVVRKTKTTETEQDMYVGDTTEIALAELGNRIGFIREQLEMAMPRVAEIPFNSDDKIMATLHTIDHEKLLYVKGAPEMVLDRATHYEYNGEVKPLTDKERIWFQQEQARMAKEGLRLLAVGYKVFSHEKKQLDKVDVKEITIVGLVGMSDPLRSDVKETVAAAQKAGIRVIMITGDHIDTACTIGRQIGLSTQKEQVIDGAGIDQLSDSALSVAVRELTICARVNPVHKIRIVHALQANGEVVAMTGDGVNDAPALKAANIGVGVGSGTDVAKEVADLVLLNDSFSTIVAAVEEGRRIYQNIKKVILYLLASSLSEVILIGGSLLAGLPLALLPAQILWINIIEDLFPNIALAFDAGDKENMTEPPRRGNQSLFDKPMKMIIVIISMVSNVVLFGLFLYFWHTTNDIMFTRTMMFVGLGANSLVYIYAVRSMRRHIWQMNPLNNHYLTAAVLFGFVMLFVAVYVPFFQYILRTVPIGLREWGIVFVFSVLNIILIEFVKWLAVNRKKVYSMGQRVIN